MKKLLSFIWGLLLSLIIWVILIGMTQNTLDTTVNIIKFIFK